MQCDHPHKNRFCSCLYGGKHYTTRNKNPGSSVRLYGHELCVSVSANAHPGHHPQRNYDCKVILKVHVENVFKIHFYGAGNWLRVPGLTTVFRRQTPPVPRGGPTWERRPS